MVFDVALGLVVTGIPCQSFEGASSVTPFAFRGHVIVGAALDRAAETAAHAGAVGVEIVGVQGVDPGGLLIVFGAQRAQYPGGFVQERGADLTHGILDHAGGEILARQCNTLEFEVTAELNFVPFTVHDDRF